MSLKADTLAIKLHGSNLDIALSSRPSSDASIPGTGISKSLSNRAGKYGDYFTTVKHLEK